MVVVYQRRTVFYLYNAFFVSQEWESVKMSTLVSCQAIKKDYENGLIVRFKIPKHIICILCSFIDSDECILL